MKIEREEFFYIKEKLKKQKDTLSMRVISDSMMPLIKIDEIIEVQNCELENLKIFDIIVFWQANKMICHIYWSASPDRPTCILTKSLKYRKNFDIETESSHYLGKVINFHVNIWWKIILTLGNFWNR